MNFERNPIIWNTFQRPRLSSGSLGGPPSFPNHILPISFKQQSSLSCVWARTTRRSQDNLLSSRWGSNSVGYASPEEGFSRPLPTQSKEFFANRTILKQQICHWGGLTPRRGQSATISQTYRCYNNFGTGAGMAPVSLEAFHHKVAQVRGAPCGPWPGSTGPIFLSKENSEGSQRKSTLE